MADITEMIRGGHVACVEREEKYIQVWWENLKEREHLEDLGEKNDNIKMHLK